MQFIQVSSFDNYVQANIQLSMLQDAGINCHLKDENIITIDPLLNPLLGGMKLMVSESQADRALAILKSNEQHYIGAIACARTAAAEIAGGSYWKLDQPTGFWKKLFYTAFCMASLKK